MRRQLSFPSPKLPVTTCGTVVDSFSGLVGGSVVVSENVPLSAVLWQGNKGVFCIMQVLREKPNATGQQKVFYFQRFLDSADESPPVQGRDAASGEWISAHTPRAAAMGLPKLSGFGHGAEAERAAEKLFTERFGGKTGVPL